MVPGKWVAQNGQGCSPPFAPKTREEWDTRKCHCKSSIWFDVGLATRESLFWNRGRC